MGCKESDTTEQLNNVFRKYTTFPTHANALSMSLIYKLFYRLGFKRSHRICLITTFFLLRQKSRFLMPIEAKALYCAEFLFSITRFSQPKFNP